MQAIKNTPGVKKHKAKSEAQLDLSIHLTKMCDITEATAQAVYKAGLLSKNCR